MRVLLDENLNWRLKRDLPGHEVESVPLLGWAVLRILPHAPKGALTIIE